MIEKLFCRRCEKEKETSLFSVDRNSKTGRQHYCKDCFKEINNSRYKNSDKTRASIRKNSKEQREKVRIFILSYLNDKKCSVCGFDNPIALQFHHRDRKEKDFNISSAVRLGYNIEKISKEIEKCDILCANCHAIIEAKINNSYRYAPVA